MENDRNTARGQDSGAGRDWMSSADEMSSRMTDLLMDRTRHTFSGRRTLEYESPPELKPNDTILYRVDRVTFEEEAPWKEALENVLSAVRVPGVNFIYCIQGTREGVRFYYGLSRQGGTETELNIGEYGHNVLQASFSGNYRGSSIKELSPGEKNQVLHTVTHMNYVSRIEGVAGSVKDDERFQSVDRLVDVMQGDQFSVVIIARAMTPREIEAAERSLYNAYDALAPGMKYSEQRGVSQNQSETTGHTEGTSNGTNTGWSHTHGTNKSTTKGKSNNSSSSSTSESGTEGSHDDDVKSGGTSETVQKSDSYSKQEGGGSSRTISREHLQKCVQDWIQYCDEILCKRLDYGRGKGLFHAAFYVCSQSRSILRKLENTVLSLYSGREKNRFPLTAIQLSASDPQRHSLEGFQIPSVILKDDMGEVELLARAMLAQQVLNGHYFPLSSWLTTKELSMIAGLPRKEVAGLRVREEVEFGLNVGTPDGGIGRASPFRDSNSRGIHPGDELPFKDTLPTGDDRTLPLGWLVKDGVPIPTPVCLNRNSLDKHLFITGVTGSGKTTTCQAILRRSGLPFLVIEPVKSEYRAMECGPAKDGMDSEQVLVFTLGNDSAAPFRLNPFELLEGESITSHVDMFRASLEAAFDMDAAIPQLLEAALYLCYEDKGWDTDTGENRVWDDPFAPGANAFPTLSDLLVKSDVVVKKQGFGDRLEGEYKGSIHARLQSLLLGAKGQMLNCSRSVSFDDLLDRQVVFELENIRSGSEKSFLMGLILARFNEAVRQRYIRDGKKHPHILLVEEAHRLLSRFQVGDSLNKKQGVEIFTDMLAEIRKYGECLIIADQIPNKLADDILKNTNTKIVHRIFAQDDKEAVGNTMALSDNQKRYLSNLPVARAIVFTEGLEQAVQTHIVRESDTSDNVVEDGELQIRAFRYYNKYDRQGLFPPLAKPWEELDGAEKRLAQIYVCGCLPLRMLRWGDKNRQVEKRDADILCRIFEAGLADVDALAEWMAKHWYSQKFLTENRDGLTDRMREYIRFVQRGENPYALMEV